MSGAGSQVGGIPRGHTAPAAGSLAMLAHADTSPERGRWLVGQKTLGYLAVAVALLCLVMVFHYLAESRAERQAKETAERLNVSLGQTALIKALENVFSDLTYLSAYHQSLGHFQSEDPTALEALALGFRTLAERKGIYDQVRFLDLAGNEIVRINYNDGDSVIVAPSELQNKVDRYYFAELTKLSAGEVYVSPLDLNVEHGRIESPAKPVIRLGTSVVGPSGAISGFVLLNYLGDVLLQGFRTATANISDHIVLLNGDGFWLSSPDREEEWGFMSGRSRTFATDHPGAWPRISESDTGQFVMMDGLFTYATVHPTRSTGGEDAGADGSAAAPRSWKIVSHRTLDSFDTAPSKFLRKYLPLYGAMLLLISLGAWLLARASVRHHLAQSRVEFEQRFREILENIDLAALGIDLEGNVIFCNEPLLELVDRRREDLIGRNWIDAFIVPEDRDSCRQALRAIATGEREISASETRIMGRDGEPRLVSWNCAPVGHADGSLGGLTFLGEDITEARAAQERVIMLSQAVDQSPATVMITDPEGAIQYVNPKFTELTGYSLDEIKGMNPRLLKSGYTPTEEYQRLWEAVSAGGEWRGVMRNRKKNGELYWEETLICAVRNLHGEIAHYMALKEDITQRRLLEERFRYCVESAPCALVLTSRDGDIVLVNRGAEKLFGYDRSELIGENIEKLVPESARARHRHALETFYRAPKPRSMGGGRELLAMRKDKSEFPVEVGLIPVEDSEEGLMALSAIVDISDRKQLQADLRDRDRRIAENDALAAIGRMANMVAHDIRNPLSSVKMSLQIIAKKKGDHITEEECELQSIALEQVRYMEDVLDDLMSYSRDDTLSPEWLQIDKLLDTAVMLVQRDIDKHGVNVVTHYQSRLPTVHGDPTQLRRAFSNLILNAVQAMEGIGERRPEVVISTHLELAPDRPKVRVEICDNGHGIPADEHSKVFEPFYTTRASGTGLGLAIVRRVIEQHHGVLDLKPGATVGTCASVILSTGPLEPVKEEEPEMSASVQQNREPQVLAERLETDSGTRRAHTPDSEHRADPR